MRTPSVIPLVIPLVILGTWIPSTNIDNVWTAGASEHDGSEMLHRRLGNARLASGVVTVIVAALSLGAGRVSPWWILLPIIALAVLVVIHDRVDRLLRTSAHAPGGSPIPNGR